MKHGAIAFDRAEVRFNLNEESQPIGVYFKISKDANHLIEEFMLLANKKVSEFVSLTRKNEPQTIHLFIVFTMIRILQN
jgi:ribonuclease R